MYHPAHPRARRRGLALFAAALALTCAASAAGSGTARAATPAPSEVTCGGHVERGTDAAVPERIDYLFACSDAVKSYTIISSAPVGSFAVDAMVFQHGNDTIVEAESFFCEGLIPGDGFNCTGGVAKGNDVHGSFELSAPVCDETAAVASTRPKVQLVIADARGATAGPFRLRGPDRCPPTAASAGPRRAGRAPRARAKRKHAGKAKPKTTVQRTNR